jgi:Transposase IS200 like
MAAAYDRQAKSAQVLFDEYIQRRLILASNDICSGRNWRLRAVGTDATHVHLLISWHDFIESRSVMNKLKNVLSYLLGKDPGPMGRRWFVRDGSQRRVIRPDHYHYLLGNYLPNHRGLFWSEGTALPALVSNSSIKSHVSASAS